MLIKLLKCKKAPLFSHSITCPAQPWDGERADASICQLPWFTVKMYVWIAACLAAQLRMSCKASTHSAILHPEMVRQMVGHPFRSH